MNHPLFFCNKSAYVCAAVVVVVAFFPFVSFGKLALLSVPVVVVVVVVAVISSAGVSVVPSPSSVDGCCCWGSGLGNGTAELE